MSVKSDLLKIANAAPRALHEALDETAEFILLLVRIYAPVKSGALRDSHDKETVTPLHIIVGTSLNYAFYINFGTSKMSANPYFTAAMHQAESFLTLTIKEKLDALIK